MKKLNFIKTILYTLILVTFFTACKKDSDKPNPENIYGKWVGWYKLTGNETKHNLTVTFTDNSGGEDKTLVEVVMDDKTSSYGYSNEVDNAAQAPYFFKFYCTLNAESYLFRNLTYDNSTNLFTTDGIWEISGLEKGTFHLER